MGERRQRCERVGSAADAYSALPLGLLGLIGGFAVPRVIVNHRARAADARIWQLWPDAVDHLRSAIRAGLSLPEALIQLLPRPGRAA